MTRTLATVVGLASLSFLVQCQGQTLQVGGPPDGGTADVSQIETGTPGPEVWTGLLDGFAFPSGSSRLTMTFTRDDGGSVMGTTYFGEQPPLPPPTDPEAGYPPGISSAGNGGSWRTPASPADSDRFAYTIVKGARQGTQLTFQVVPDELYKAWCELQTTIYPFYNGNADGGFGDLLGYDCLPNAMTTTTSSPTDCSWNDGDGTGDHTVACQKMRLCGGPARHVCTCSASKCTVDIASPDNGKMSFDLKVDGTTAKGSVTGLIGVRVSFELTRQ